MLAWDGVDLIGPLRSTLRRALIGLLGTMLTGYLAVFPSAVMGTVISGWLAWRSGWTRAGAVRWLLLCGSTVLGLGLAEAGAAAWLAWIHRLPSMPGRFAAPTRPGDEVSIVVIGGSSALGVPYEGWLSVGTIVGRELGRAIPDRRFRVEVLAEKGATLESMHQKLARLPYRPDVLIVYSGHNEFVTRFSWLHRVAYYDDEPLPSRQWEALQRLASVSPLFRLVRENLEKQRVGLIPTRMFGPRETLVGRPVCTPEEAAAIVADFRRRLESIVAGCERIGCLPILIVPPGCDTWDPNQSHADRLDETGPARGPVPPDDGDPRAGSQRPGRRHRRLSRGRRRSTDAGRGPLPTGAAASSRPDRSTRPRLHYGLARDRDGLPMRCIMALEDAYRVVARRSPRALLVDGPAVLRSRSRHGIFDSTDVP